MTTYARQPEHAETSAQADVAPHAALRAPALATLWQEARAFVSFMFELFNVDHLRTTGISRRSGVQLSAYLANIESGLRRLILAAALIFTPPAPRVSKPRPPPPIAPVKDKPRRYRAGLRIIRLASPDPTPAIPSQFAGKARPAPWKSYGHMPYQGDPLLGQITFYAAYATRPRDHVLSLRARNPLDRWVRLSPRDPDWRSPETRDPWATPEDPSPRQPRTRRKSPRKRKPPQTLEGLPDSLWDWRRREEAWAHVVPAPDFAARLEALQRIAAHPGALITRTARRLQSLRGPVRSRAATRWPAQRPPRRAQDFVRRTYRENFAPRCHALILDTS